RDPHRWRDQPAREGRREEPGHRRPTLSISLKLSAHVRAHITGILARTEYWDRRLLGAQRADLGSAPQSSSRRRRDRSWPTQKRMFCGFQTWITDWTSDAEPTPMDRCLNTSMLLFQVWKPS